MENDNKDKKRLSFKERISRVKWTRWLRFGIVSAIFFGFVCWLGNPWVALAWILLADIYILQYIPWTWWKSTKGFTRTIMAWVDAILYALVLVYFIFAFIGQNYQIPSSSLEKSLLVGDYLWVSKTVYGPRVPQTPLHFPLAHHTIPLLNVKSYIDKPQLDYHRLPGARSVERGDIVVFNFPQGDTVLSNFPDQNYYMILQELRKEGIADPRRFIAENPRKFGKIIVRPVDRRENYVKRAIGLPGDRFQLRGDTVFINGKALPEPENLQFNYIVPVTSNIDPQKWQELGVRLEDVAAGPQVNQFNGSRFYSVPLTRKMLAEVKGWPEVNGEIIREGRSGIFLIDGVFPQESDYGWTRADTKEFWIPKRGVTLRLNPGNLPLYERAIRTYEGNDLEVRDGKIFINGKQTDSYTFKYDYYWMMGDNRDRSLDSRYFGFVPEDHVIGSPMFIIVSIDQEKSLTEKGKIRTERILRDANPDKKLF